MLSKKIILLLFILPVFCAVTNNVVAQKKDTSIKKVSITQQAKSNDSEQIKALSNSVQELKVQNAGFEAKVNTLTWVFSLFSGLIGIILIIGTATSLYTWTVDKKRSEEAYNLSKKRDEQIAKREQIVYTRQDELYALSLERDKQTSAREQVMFARQDELYTLSLEKDKQATDKEASIFRQSTDTLTLVNQTLELARDASERASRSLEAKLNKKHQELEQEAIELIEESNASKNYKILVEESSVRSNLLTLALEIAGLQNNLNILERDVILHPACSFIRGMEFHLNQHFKTAIKYWKQAKEHAEATGELKTMALYWIAYEQNNLGNFENAATNFEIAANIAQGPVRFELNRIKLESKFFDSTKNKPEDIMDELLALYRQVNEESDSEEIKKAKSSIASTIGNIYHEMGNKAIDDPQKAKEYYTNARNFFKEAPNKTKWTWFGFAEASYKLGKIKEAENAFLDKVKSEAEFEYSTRLEPRTKVLGQATVLICSVRIKSLNENVNALSNLIRQTLGGVDERLTVYSQFQRRNVDKKTFVNDLEAFIAQEYNPPKEESAVSNT